MTTQYTKADAAKAIPTLRRFMSEAQISALGDACYGEERHYFINKIVELAEHLDTMPKTYEQDGKGDDAVVHLHYFLGGMDWYITEKDMEAEQHQAFGLACGMFTELGYISIDQITKGGAELDLYWEPKTLREVKAA